MLLQTVHDSRRSKNERTDGYTYTALIYIHSICNKKESHSFFSLQEMQLCGTQSYVDASLATTILISPGQAEIVKYCVCPHNFPFFNHVFKHENHLIQDNYVKNNSLL